MGWRIAMSKRFTDSQKWTAKPWFRKLSPTAKLLWLYVCDACDVAGVIDLDMEMASFLIGDEITEDHIKEIGKQFMHMDGARYWIKDFVPFQCGELKEKCPPHRKVITLLKGYRKGSNTLLEILNTLSTTLSNRVQEEEEEEDKDKDKDKDKEKRGAGRTKPETHDDTVNNLIVNGGFDDIELVELFQDWADERRDNRHYLTERSLKMALKTMGNYPIEVQKAALKTAIAGSHKSLHPESVRMNSTQQPRQQTLEMQMY